MEQGVSSVLIWTSLVLGFITLLLYMLKRSKISQMIDKLPGPKSNFIFGNALEFIGHPEEVPKIMAKWLKTFGEDGILRVWIGPMPFVLLCKANTVEALLSSPKLIEKSDSYRFLQPWLGLGILTSYGDKWHTRRKLLTPAFHFRILADFMPVFNEMSVVLVKNLHNEVGKDQVDIFPPLTLCALDIICSSAMGCEINAQSQSESEYIQAIYIVCKTVYKRIISPWYHSDIIFYNTPLGREYSKSLKTLHDFTEKVIAERKEYWKHHNLEEEEKENQSVYGKKRRLAFLDLLLLYSDNGRLLSDKDIREEVDTLMFGGHDTTAATMYWILFFIGQNPDIQAKVHEEIDRIFCGDTERPVTTEDLKELKYFECVCKETLRMCPIAPMYARKLTEDLPIGEHTIPAGVSCAIVPFLLHNDAKYYPNPGKFDPDRFLPENTKGRHPYAFIPFSAGPRNCLGQKYAMMELKVVLSHVLRNFKVNTLHKGRVKASAELILRPSKKIRFTIERRTFAN